MSYGITPIAVDLALVTAALGSKDARLLTTLVAEFAHRIRELNRRLNDEEPPLPMEDVLRHMVMGEPYVPEYGYKYGYAFEFLCLNVGEHLTNDHWTGTRWEWVEQVDANLKDAGVDPAVLSVGGRLLCRGAPIDLPRIEDFPSIGHLLRTEVPAALEALSAPKAAWVPDHEVNESVGELRSWLVRCRQLNRDLVCFYY